MKNFSGIITALVTPFLNGEVDEKSLKKLVQDQLAKGVDGFVVHGTTAESPTTNATEKERIFHLVQQEVSGKVPLLVGVGTNSTQTTIENAKTAEAWGADGVLVVVPYYNKPTQKGLLAHFKAVAENISLPIVLYNVPGRTVASLAQETILELAKVPQIVAIKEATGDVAFGESLVQKTAEDFNILSGDDGTCMELAAKGGKGVISVSSHIIPTQMKDIYEQTQTNPKAALEAYKKFAELMSYLYIESNPIPVKYFLKSMGIIDSAEMRLPLVELSETYRSKVDEIVRGLN